MRGRAALLVTAGIYLAARLAITLTSPVLEHPDTPSYRDGVSLLGNARRTWPVPLALEVFGDRGLTVFQTVVSAVAFLVLAWSLARLMEDRRVGYGIAAIVLTLGLTARVTYWDANLLSESLAISATALLIAALAHIDRCPTAALIAAFTLWVFVRDGHVYVGLIVVVGVCWWGARNRRWIAPACIIAVTVWCGLAEKNNRYVEGFNVGTNIAVLAPHGSENYEWFRQHGMPDSAALETPGWRDRSWALWDDQTFGDWARDDGVATYARFLVEHPRWTAIGLERLFIDGGIAPPESLVDHTAYEYTTSPGPNFVWPKEGSAFTVALALAALVGAAVTWRRHRFDRRWVVPAVMAASTVPHALLAFHVSPFEIARKGVILAFVLVVACWWMIALAIDSSLSGDEPDDTEGAQVGDAEEAIEISDTTALR